MKTVSLLLALFVFGLAIMPCTDTMIADHDHSHSDTETISDIEAHSHDHNHGDEEDSCPPFCACQCCGIHVLGPNNSTAEYLEPKVSDNYVISYTFNYSYQFLGGIWHPPAVS